MNRGYNLLSMVKRPSCSTNVSDESKFCPECGVALRTEYAPTEVPAKGGSSSQLSSSRDSHHGRFLPGIKINDRLRFGLRFADVMKS